MNEHTNVNASEAAAAIILEELGDGIVNVNGKNWIANAKGNLEPLDTIKPEDFEEDQTVRKVMSFAIALSEQLDRFRLNTMADLEDFDRQLAAKYQVTKGGPKGNRTYQSFDGLLRIKVQVADFIDFGPQLQMAKKLIDECLNEWAESSRLEIQAIITSAFNTDKEGKINKSEVLMLLRKDFDDPRWKRAMDAIRDAMRVTGSKEYVRFYMRTEITDPWQAVTIDLAKAGA